MVGDLKDFYLGTPMARYEYMRIPVWAIPDSIMDLYNLHDLVEDSFVWVEIRKGMYGLPQAGRIANDRLTNFLEPHGYVPMAITPGLWKHKTRPIQFALVVDDFGVKYTNREDAEHLMAALEEQYTVTKDWDGTRYCGLTLEWDYSTARTCDVSMPGYIERVLQRFKHSPPARRQDSPHAWQKPAFGAKVQFAPEPDNSPGQLSMQTTTKRSKKSSAVSFSTPEPLTIPCSQHLAPSHPCKLMRRKTS
jgi:hypothetical protein